MQKLMRSRILLGVMAGLMGLVVETEPLRWIEGNLTSQVEARVGRPATPVSAAGVARRSTRRVVRRTTVYIATLPVGCVTVVIDNMSLYSCGGVYYQPYQNQYVVVVID
ncbi:hypothetical protein SAMN04488103_101174 [Gemmobacter aquatilis]|uniref:Uncharacterized protein n=1 Tax=Gemmobacter aquatilis TaxID=933059 RepID=A0A1H7YEV2_9RHOB|nr:hypothetical protein [Gemmobacter aquatilis]SEM44473.1 hypothetical protein SAMN04488103_101174 [Gemmobacter aquatilis]